MTGKPEAPERLSLSRWSRRKLEASSEPPAAPASAAPSPPAAAAPAAPAAALDLPTELPGVESLSFDSDFTAFLRPEVDEKLKRAALKQLFRDPRFNVMDGLDVYIDDYTKADPIAPDIVQDLLQRGFSAVTAAPNWPSEEPSANANANANASGASAPSVTGPAAESLPAPETTVASSTPNSAEVEPTPEPAPEQPDPSRSS